MRLTYLAFAALISFPALNCQSVSADDVKSTSQNNRETVLFLLDCSRLMKSPIKGHAISKLDESRKIIKNIVDSLPPSTPCGLRTFGTGECNQTDLVVPIRSGKAQLIIETTKLDATSSDSRNLGYAIRLAAERDLNNHIGVNNIVLITSSGDKCGSGPENYITSVTKNPNDKLFVLALAEPGSSAEKDIFRDFADVAKSDTCKNYSADGLPELIADLSSRVKQDQPQH